MKKSYLFIAAAALFAACSSDSLTVEKDSPQNPAAAEQAVNFDVYVGRGLTRAGTDGPISNTDALTTGTHASDGFGVFGYYTDGERYSGITKPNFFYNQKVYYSSGWTYEPLKYWPNEFGSDAISDQVDRVTLFAYAPYVPVTPLTGVVTGDQNTNIIGMSRNNVTGDPYVKYVATMDAKNSVDLCYGVAADNFTSSNSSLNQNNIKKGKPYIDVVKPGTDANSKIKFDFKHATAQLRVTVDADVTDMTSSSPLANGVQTDYTRIWIRSVTFEGITQKGSLNLNGGEWYDMNGTNKITTGSLTVYDGRKDGKEAILEATNETPSTINPKLIQSEAYTLTTGKITAPSTTDGPGVTKTKENLFVSSSLEDPIFVIPTNEKMKVTIVYDVETVDPNLAYYLSDGSTLGSSIENSISKTIDTFGNITAGYCYTLNLHLGMRTVDFDAVVTEWQDQQADVDLPSNLQTFKAASSSPGAGTVTLSATAEAYDFAVSGLKANTAPTTVTTTGATVTAGVANGSGISKISVTGIPANTTTSNQATGTITIGDGTNSVVVTVNKTAAPINFSNIALYPNVIVMYWNSALTDVTTANSFKTLADASKGSIKVFKNGVDITSSCTFSGSNKEITIPDGTGSTPNLTLTTGDVIKVELQANNAAMESQTKTY